ncbi:23S rRNA (adenine(2030)-N(6))-methyltransferase RlmJ [Pseudaminobacter sp. 19-2017]|uniref:Ribosomal RNA large subunit methyltransferase J n=1 Tax=Pseudaminobacter soli (ex Zhang et al. 2022) TaxID=2831468 RepID=A0A942DZ05_9HYPH|nr:23S rRNA (adenine(2030)-N(6))-methyltransferase RlmJ [Pseudaminobacter soli]
MNYRHSFHAGNFADVLKHVVLMRILEYLKLKDKAFRVIDTHAGVGLYDLEGERAARTGEWLGGIGRLRESTLPDAVRALIAPYLEAVSDLNEGDRLRYYPGSPMIVRQLLRRQDRLTAIELHPEDARDLAANFAGDHQVRVIELDGWLALGAHLPPKEKRGLVLVDPPFEQLGEFARMIEGLKKAHRRWPGGIYALWYPIKDRPAVAAFEQELRELGILKILAIRQEVRPPSAEPRLDGSGMIVVNPPYTLAAELKTIMPALQKALAEAPAARWSLEWLSTEATAA